MKILDTTPIATLALALAMASLVAAPRPAAGQTGPSICGPPAMLADLLRRTYGEVLRVRATEASGVIIEFYVAPTGTWTMLLVHGQGGASCVGTSGKDWQEHRDQDAARPQM